MGGVTLESIDGAVMLALLSAEAHVDFNTILLLGCLHQGTLLSADQVFEWRCIGVVFKTGASEDLGGGLVSNGVAFVHYKLFERSIAKFSLVPPEKSTIGGGRDAFGGRLTKGEPVNVVNWVVMALLKESGCDRLNHA